MRIVSTEDVAALPLSELQVDLQSEFDLSPQESRFFARSLDAPSWVRLIAELSWWQQALAAAAALYVAELVKEAAKDTWNSRAKLIAAAMAAGGAVKRLAARLQSFKAKLSPRTQVILGLPEPDEYFGVHLELPFDDAATTELAVALFVYYQPAVSRLIAEHQAAGIRASTGYFLEIQPNASLRVWWFDSKSLQREEAFIALTTTEG
ncbi:hypothetical protein FBR04_06830 [Betaproteobacteria bacterium PRO7]|jgi:hypothetical protein|nr:hypothetical protein [Betaproteobacteria bacterium PRO7]